MAGSRELRRRIRSIASTAQITRAMQMVAASKMRKAQQLAIEVRPFVRWFYRIQRAAAAHAHDFTHPLLEPRPVRTRAVVLVAADKGLCGALNSNVFRLAAQYDPQTTVFLTAGRRASQFVAQTRRRLLAEFSYGDTPQFAESKAIATLARELFEKGEVDSVDVVAARFVNTLVQQPVVVPFLPLGDLKGLEVPGMPPPIDAGVPEFVFEPDAGDIVSYAIGHYVNVFVHVVLLNAKASEQSARMVSMQGATDSATAMIRELALEYNKLRQGRITQELLEIAGGASM
ncbi:MAG TPA: ATP synthase F1 subunit gamma [Vicinamibacterales bacterium]|nr:ATP synthase F1 subunit gamma [Vicinamibacterales bacterium]